MARILVGIYDICRREFVSGVLDARPSRIVTVGERSLLKSPVHTSNNVEATFDIVAKKRQQCRTSFALKFRPFDKVERCFDIVASVDRA